MKKFSLEYCLGLARESCKGANHRVIKSLRMTLDNLTPLLKANPRLKVVHLFRDPRAIFNSRIGTMYVPIKNLYPLDENKLLHIRSAIKTTCERHLIDLEASEMLRNVYPDRFKVIQYENLFSEPVSRGVKDLYEFAGMNYGSEQQLQ